MLVGGGCSGESCSSGIRNPQRREFPGEETVWFLLQWYLKYAEHLRKPVFLLRRYFIHTEHHVGVMSGAFFYPSCTLNKSAKVPLRLLSVFYFLPSQIEYRWSKNCSTGNPPPFENPGLKCTQTDAILKNM
jgi:hypothetical protein